MTTENKSEDVFDLMSPFDGLKVTQVDRGEGYSALYLSARQDAETVGFMHNVGEDASVVLAEWRSVDKPISNEQRGEISRMKLVTEAIARYFTTGGGWAHLSGAINVMRQFSPGILSVPDYFLLSSEVDGEGNHEHIFLSEKDTDLAVIWVEDQFIEKRSLSEMRNGPAAAEEPDADEEGVAVPEDPE